MHSLHSTPSQGLSETASPSDGTPLGVGPFNEAPNPSDGTPNPCEACEACPCEACEAYGACEACEACETCPRKAWGFSSKPYLLPRIASQLRIEARI